MASKEARAAADSVRMPFGQDVNGMGVAVLSVPEARAEEAYRLLNAKLPE